MNYSEEYYKQGNYEDYLFREEKYVKLAKDIGHLLSNLCIVEKDIKILDYGCAVGLFMKGLEKFGYTNIFGYDVSSWAIEQLPKRFEIIDINKKNSFDIMFMLDVLEHMTDKQIIEVFKKIESKNLIIRIPVSTNGGKNFHYKISNLDPTHINCKQKEDWINLFKSIGYDLQFELNLNLIYSSKGVFCGILKQKKI